MNILKTEAELWSSNKEVTIEEAYEAGAKAMMEDTINALEGMAKIAESLGYYEPKFTIEDGFKNVLHSVKEYYNKTYHFTV